MNNSCVTRSVKLPATVQLRSMEPDSFVAWYLENKPELEDRLQKEGAIKIRGVPIDSADTFQRIVDAISSKFLQYIDGNSPRTRLSGHVYTSTEFDPAQRITMHNELSYSAKWPNKLFFTCLQPAVTGGETLLADSREILQRMDPDIVREVEERGITYIRNLHGGRGMGPSWQETFETNDKCQAEEYCRSYRIGFEWGAGDCLRLIQPSKGILRHRSTGERVWFNQIDQFHPSHLGEEMYEVIQLMYGDPGNFPMYVRFGDGTPISASLISVVLRTIDEVTVAPVWGTDELLIIDNELVSHGRNPFSGERKVLVAMSE